MPLGHRWQRSQSRLYQAAFFSSCATAEQLLGGLEAQRIRDDDRHLVLRLTDLFRMKEACLGPHLTIVEVLLIETRQPSRLSCSTWSS